MMWALITANYQIVALLLIALVVIAELVRRGSPELILDALFVCLAVTRPSFAAAGMLIAQYTIRSRCRERCRAPSTPITRS